MQTKKIINPVAVINQLKKKKKTFFIFQTLYTKKIFTETENFSYTQKTDLKNADLNFIMQVKAYAQKLEGIPQLTSSDVYYIDKSSFLPEGKEFKKCYEIDLNSAFWNFAYREKFIGEPLYEKGLKMPKKTRLIALGALAKKITVMKYTGEEFMPIEFIKSVKTQGVFFKVAQLTSELMQSLKFISDTGYLFFWCDAIFLKDKETFLKCCEYLEAMHYEFKSYEIDLIKYANGELNVISRDYSEKHPQKKNKIPSSVWNRVFTFEPPKKKNNTFKFFNSPLKQKQHEDKSTATQKEIERTAPEEIKEDETPF